MHLNLIIMGPQGAGKGTMAKMIADRYNIPHISTGDLFRKYKDDGTALGLKAYSYWGKGKLVPDDLTIAMLRDRLAQPDCQNGYILDGFPRTLPQAQELDLAILQGDLREITALIALDASPTATAKQYAELKKVIVDRLAGRLICPVCQATYHIKNLPPKKDSLCDHDGTRLIKREDDTPEKIAKRLQAYEDQTRPLLEYYIHSHGQDFVHFVDPARKPTVIFKDISTILDNL